MMRSQLSISRVWHGGVPKPSCQSRHALRPDPRALASGLLALHPAWLLIDAQGRVCDLSRRARSLMGPRLDLDGERGVKSAMRGDHEALQALVQAALSAPLPGWSGTILIREEDGPGILGVIAVSLGLDGAALLLRDLSGQRESRIEAFLVELGLSGAEARVAVRIGSGESPSVVARALGVTQDTVRSQLRATFNKLGFRRQSQVAVLVTRLESCLPAMPEDRDALAVLDTAISESVPVPFPAIARRSGDPAGAVSLRG